MGGEMKLENQVCNLDLAKKLKELGVKQESLFGWVIFGDGYEKGHRSYKENYELRSQESKTYFEDSWISAFTVAELGEMLPLGFRSGKAGNKKIGYKTYSAHSCGVGGFHEQFDSQSEADSRALCLIFCIENNLIEVNQ
jgi:hypothetical protein